MQQMRFNKNDVVTLTCFGHYAAKIKDIILKFCMRVFVCILIKYIPVFGQLEKFGFYGQLLLKKQNFEFWGPK